MDFNKPEYFFQPRKLIRRLLQFKRPKVGERRRVSCFGMEMDVDISETIGASLWRFGIYDLALSEVLWRLLSPGERAWDVGGGLGCMTALMIKRLGRQGQVVVFEPNSFLGQRLCLQLQHWKESGIEGDFPDARIFMSAVAEGGGVRKLQVPSEFSKNWGLSTLVPLDVSAGISSSGKGSFEEVVGVELDQITTELGSSPHLIKLDIEGGELSALKSGRRMIGERKVRDIVFEEHGAFPTSVTDYLEKAGYDLFRIGKNFFGPILVRPDLPIGISSWEPTNYLATLEPARALNRMKPRGWRVLA